MTSTPWCPGVPRLPRLRLGRQRDPGYRRVARRCPEGHRRASRRMSERTSACSRPSSSSPASGRASDPRRRTRRRSGPIASPTPSAPSTSTAGPTDRHRLRHRHHLRGVIFGQGRAPGRGALPGHRPSASTPCSPGSPPLCDGSSSSSRPAGIGRSTVESIQSGVIYGYTKSLVDGMCRADPNELDAEATGGRHRWAVRPDRPAVRGIDHVEPWPPTASASSTRRTPQ